MSEVGASRESEDGPLLVRIPMRWGDLDAQGHVNNALIVEYIQEARCWEMLEGPNAHLVNHGLIVVRNHVLYKRPLTYSDDLLTIAIAPVRVGAATVVYGFRVYSGGVLCAHARTALCPYDFENLTPRRFTAEERAAFDEQRLQVMPLEQLKTPRLQGRGIKTPLWTRWGDVDRYGHVNNVRYYDYFQEARITVTTALDPGTARAGVRGADDSQQWLVARQDVDYVGQMHSRLSPYEVLTAPTRLGDTSVVLASEIIDPEAGDEVMARGRTVLVRADAAGRPIPLSAQTREAFGAAIVE